MKHKLLVTTLIALGLSASGIGHALLIMMPDGTKVEAQVTGNRLMLVDANGKLTPARDGTYKTGSGTAIIVRGGVIASQGAIAGPIGNKVTGAITGPVDSKVKGVAAASPQAPTAPAAASPVGRTGALPPAAGSAAMNVVRIEQLSSKAQFKALPDDTLLEIDGKKVRKADFVADFNRRAAANSAIAAIGPSTLPGIKAQLVADENAAIAASDADVRRRIVEIRAQGVKP